MSTSTIELIAADILAKLVAIDDEGLTLNAYRKCKAKRDTPVDGDCEVAFETVEELDTQYHSFRCLVATFSITYFIIDGQDETTPIDGQLFQAWAAIHDALMNDLTRSGNAQRTEIAPPAVAWGEENQMAAIIIPVRVFYRHPLTTMTVALPDPTP